MSNNPEKPRVWTTWQPGTQPPECALGTVLGSPWEGCVGEEQQEAPRGVPTRPPLWWTVWETERQRGASPSWVGFTRQGEDTDPIPWRQFLSQRRRAGAQASTRQPPTPGHRGFLSPRGRAVQPGHLPEGPDPSEDRGTAHCAPQGSSVPEEGAPRSPRPGQGLQTAPWARDSRQCPRLSPRPAFLLCPRHRTRSSPPRSRHLLGPPRQPSGGRPLGSAP